MRSKKSKIFSEKLLLEKRMLPLKGIKVVDLTRVLAGPYCTMLLADLGADVIKIEKPVIGDDTRAWGPPFIETKDGKKQSVYFLTVNRNKKSITLDLKKQESVNILKKLVEKSDVLVENYLPGKLNSMNLGYDHLSKVNPGLIYCSISGFGPTGPYAKRGGYDVIASAMFGLMNVTGYPDQPPAKVGVALTDISTGIYMQGAIMAALIQKMKTGLGQKIDASLLNTQIAILANLGTNYLTAGVNSKRYGTAHESIVPYQAFKTKDGRYLIIGCGNNKHFNILAKLLGFNKDFADNPKFNTNAARVSNRVELIEILNNKLLEKDLSEWLKIFEGTDMPYGPINDMKQVFEDPQVIHNKMVQTINDPRFKTPIRLSSPAVTYSSFSNDDTLRSSPPLLGEHTIEVLKELGYTETEIEQFKLNKII